MPYGINPFLPPMDLSPKGPLRTQQQVFSAKTQVIELHWNHIHRLTIPFLMINARVNGYDSDTTSHFIVQCVTTNTNYTGPLTIRFQQQIFTPSVMHFSWQSYLLFASRHVDSTDSFSEIKLRATRPILQSKSPILRHETFDTWRFQMSRGGY